MKIFHLLLTAGIVCLLSSCNDSNPAPDTVQQQLDTALANRSSQLAMLNSRAIAGNFSNPVCLTPKAADFDQQGRLTQAYINKVQSAKEQGVDCQM